MKLRVQIVITGGYNDGYKAMGDAVAAPVAEYLGRQLLLQLTEAAYAVRFTALCGAGCGAGTLAIIAENREVFIRKYCGVYH